MFESVSAVDLLREIRAHDYTSDPADEAGASRIEAIKALDRLISSAQAAQLDQIGALRRERRELIPLGGADPALSVTGEVAMARNISPSTAGTQFGLAMALPNLPHVSDLFHAGIISEAVVRAVIRESESLALDDFIILDGEIAPRLPGLTHVKAAQLTRYAVISIDAEAARTRAATNRADCRITLCPEPDGVAILRVRGPAEQMVAVHNALDAWAQGLRSTGDQRTTGQIAVQTLVERVTGVAFADSIDVEISLVMNAATLVGGGDQPADLAGYGPISPDIADELITRAHHASVRRLLTDPVDGTLLARDPRRRRFDGPLAAHIRSRDRRCRQPGCDCKIRDLDHIEPYETGGATTEHNGQGLCERSHTIKHQPGWKVTTQGKTTTWTTPTGHQYHSNPPSLLGHLRQ